MAAWPHCGQHPGNHRRPWDGPRAHHVLGPLPCAKCVTSLHFANAHHWPYVLNTNVAFVGKENEAQKCVIAGQCRVACEWRGWGSEPHLQAQNLRHYVWSRTHERMVNLLLPSRHRDHYIHLCLMAEAGPGWALPTLSHYASKQRMHRNLPKVMQIPTAKQDLIPLCLVETMKSGFSCSGL